MARPGDELEVEVEGFVADIRRGDLLIEIQTSAFGAMGRKLDRVLNGHRVLVVHPIATETYLVRPEAKPRRSPKRGDLYGLFDELVSIPTLIDHPNLAIEVLLVAVDKYQEADPTLRRNRGGWRTYDRRLRQVHSRHRFDGIGDLAALLPAHLPPVFTTADLARAVPTTRDRAQRMAYCLRQVGVLEVVDRIRAGHRYRRR
jgi:hypothetical protein